MFVLIISVWTLIFTFLLKTFGFPILILSTYQYIYYYIALRTQKIGTMSNSVARSFRKIQTLPLTLAEGGV